jgi:tRNA 2-thiocytidine biosynthesis protein TtcA
MKDRHTGQDQILKVMNARLDKAVWEYKMFQDNDRILLAVSGGADSMSLLRLLAERYFIYAKNLQLSAVFIDLGFGPDQQVHGEQVLKFGRQLNVPVHTVATQIGPYSHSDKNSENPCFLCTRIRRKYIFETAEKCNCNKIVFGHHKDDLVETLLINMIFGREISTSPAVLKIKNGKYHILRPYIFTEEALIKCFADKFCIPTFSQNCPTDGHSKRQAIKELLADLEKRFPGSRDNIFYSMKKVKPDYLL